MARTARASVGGICYHVMNRGNGRADVFHDQADYEAFVEMIGQAYDRIAVRVLGYCLMPNHFHLVLWPREDADLSRWMQWLMTSHVRRYHRRYGTSGHVWGGRFKSFPVQSGMHLLTALRYVERNPLTAGIVSQAEDWSFSSLGFWNSQPLPGFLFAGPVSRGADWVKTVNEVLREKELEALRRSIFRGSPLGEPSWTRRIAVRLGLESALRPRGRPRKEQRGAKKKRRKCT